MPDVQTQLRRNTRYSQIRRCPQRPTTQQVPLLSQQHVKTPRPAFHVTLAKESFSMDQLQVAPKLKEEDMSTSTAKPAKADSLGFNLSNRSTSSTSKDERRKSCHRCGNSRKSMIHCDACPQVYCTKCANKMKTEYGADCFLTDCPSCRGECCCRRKNPSCPRKVHCYKKCPAVDHKIRTIAKAALLASSETRAVDPTKSSPELPTLRQSPSNQPTLDSIQSLLGYIETEYPHQDDDANLNGVNLPKSKRRRVGPLLEEHVKDTLNPLLLRSFPVDSFPSTKWSDILSDLLRQVNDNLKEADHAAMPSLQFCHGLDATLSASQSLPTLKQLTSDREVNLFAIFPHHGSSTKQTTDQCVHSPVVSPDNPALSFMTPDSSWLRLFSHPFARSGAEPSPLSLPILQTGPHGTVATIPSLSGTGSSTKADSSPPRIDKLQTLLQNPLLLKPLPITTAALVSNSTVSDDRSPGQPTTDSSQQTTIQPPYTGEDHGNHRSAMTNGWKPSSETFADLMRSIDAQSSKPSTICSEERDDSSDIPTYRLSTPATAVSVQDTADGIKDNTHHHHQRPADRKAKTMTISDLTDIVSEPSSDVVFVNAIGDTSPS